MTAEDFIRESVVFAGWGQPWKARQVPPAPPGMLSVYGPNDEALMAQLEGEVARRVPAASELKPAKEIGACAQCGDPMPPYRGGDCPLCILARQRWLAGRKRAWGLS